jgi:hypothetical protein
MLDMGKLLEYHVPSRGSGGADAVIIRWGQETSSDMLRRSARSARCGRKGASLTHPSWVGLDVGFAPFPES